MTTSDNKMTLLSLWVSSACLKLKCHVLNVIGMHLQFPAAAENLIVSSFYLAQHCVTFTVDNVKGESGMDT